MCIEGRLPVKGNVLPNDSMGHLSLGLAEMAEDLKISALFVPAKLTKRLLTSNPNASKVEVAIAVYALTQFTDNTHHITDAAATAYVGFYASEVLQHKRHIPLERLHPVISQKSRFVFEVLTLRRQTTWHKQGTQLDWLKSDSSPELFDE